MAEEPVKKNLDVSYQPEIPSHPENWRMPGLEGPTIAGLAHKARAFRKPSLVLGVPEAVRRAKEATGKKPWECPLSLQGSHCSQRPHCAQLSQRVRGTTRISGSLSCGAREVRSPCAWRGGARPGSPTP